MHHTELTNSKKFGGIYKYVNANAIWGCVQCTTDKIMQIFYDPAT